MADIIELLERWDEQGLVLLKDKYSEYCYSIIYRLLRNHEQTEEALSDVWLRVWNSIPPARPQRFRACLAKTARNTALHYIEHAPAYSLALFHSSLPLGWAVGLYYGAKLLVMAAVGEACFFLSSRCTKNRDAILLCCGVILIPAALAAIGSVVGAYLSFLLPLGGAELLHLIS